MLMYVLYCCDPVETRHLFSLWRRLTNNPASAWYCTVRSLSGNNLSRRCHMRYYPSELLASSSLFPTCTRCNSLAPIHSGHVLVSFVFTPLNLYLSHAVSSLAMGPLDVGQVRFPLFPYGQSSPEGRLQTNVTMHGGNESSGSACSHVHS
jgi:hypothetical protein